MPDSISVERRHFVTTSAFAIVAGALFAGSARAEAKKEKSMGIPAVAAGSHKEFEHINQVDAGELNIGYVDVGPKNGTPVLLLHGWPYDIHSFIDVAPVLADAGYRVLIPYLRGYGTTRFLSEKSPRNCQQATLAIDALNFLDALKIDKAILGGFDWGGRTACALAALWPERFTGLVAVSGYTIASQDDQALKTLPPEKERDWWYLFYFATERGRIGYRQYTRDFVRLTWKLASPKWAFDDATFARSAKAFENPDHVDITVNSYRWRLKLVESEAKYDDIERKLAAHPTIGLSTITLEGDANGALHAEPATYAKFFTGSYEHRLTTGGIGHNLPQEDPTAFAQAIVDVDRMNSKKG